MLQVQKHLQATLLINLMFQNSMKPSRSSLVSQKAFPLCMFLSLLLLLSLTHDVKGSFIKPLAKLKNQLQNH